MGLICEATLITPMSHSKSATVLGLVAKNHTNSCCDEYVIPAAPPYTQLDGLEDNFGPYILAYECLHGSKGQGMTPL